MSLFPPQNFLTRQFNQGGMAGALRRYGSGGPGRVMNAPQGFAYDPSAGNYSNNVPGSLGGPPAGGGGPMGGVDPRRAKRDPRWQRGVHPRQAGASPDRNVLMQRFQRPSWAPQSAQGYRRGSSYTQGQGPRYSPPQRPSQGGAWGGVQNWLAQGNRPQWGARPQQPTAPRTMGRKPRGTFGRMMY